MTDEDATVSRGVCERQNELLDLMERSSCVVAKRLTTCVEPETRESVDVTRET